MKSLNKILSACIILVLCSTLTACGREELKPLQRTDIAMGTIINQSIYIEEKSSGGSWLGSFGENSVERSNENREETGFTDLTQEVMSLIDSLEKELLSWRLDSSEIYRINQESGKDGGTEVSESLYTMLEHLLEVSGKSNGALDITIGDVVRLWDIDEYASGEKTGFRLPDQKLLTEALKLTGYQKIAIENGRIYLPEGMNLDLGAVGKGAALDTIAEYFVSRPQVTGAVISVGGSILTYGRKPDASDWRVAVIDPLNPSQSIGYLALEGNWCISTSGDYERYVELEGKRYHHIIDPSTGYPADSGVKSVTVLGRDGLMSDALSTACFVLGVQEGIRLAHEFGAEVLFVDENGKITMSEGMMKYYHGN